MYLSSSPISLLLYPKGGAASGGAALIPNEANGFATDFLYPAAAQRVAVKTAGNVVSYAENDFYTQAGTSAKTVYDINGVLGWSPHNLLAQSKDFTNAIWSKSGTFAYNAAAAPNGLMEACKLSDNGSGFIVVYQDWAGTIAGNASVYAKAGELNQVYIGSLASPIVDGFDLTTGTTFVVKSGGAAQPTTGTAKMENVGNGWWRCSSSFTAMPDFVIGPAVNQDYVWTPQIGAGVYFWGPQFSRGSVALPYLPTTTAARFGLALDYDQATHAPRGLLCEPAATNLVVQSAAGRPGNIWLGNGSTKTTSVQPDPSGGFEAVDVVITPGSGPGAGLNLMAMATTVIGTTYTASMWCKGVPGQQQWFCMDANATRSHQKLITFTGNWQRVSHTFVATVTNSYIGFECYDRTGGAQHLPAITFQAWGGQYEVGTVPTSYIPTLAATVTRATDLPTITPASINYSATAGSWWVDIDQLSPQAAGRVIGNATGTTPIYVASNVSVGLYDAIANVVKTIPSTLGQHKLASAFASADRAFTADGLTVALDTQAGASLLSPGTTIGIGTEVNAANHCYVRQVYYVPRRMTNTELQTKTVLTGGKAALAAEANGMSTDFIYADDTQRVAVRTAGIIKELGLDAFYQNTGGSPKQVYDIEGKLGWSPHNLELYSEDFTNAAWIKGGCTVVANATTAPDGALTADKFVENAAAASKFLQQVGPRANNGNFSVYAKAGERSKIVLQDLVRGSVGDGFDLIAGTVYALNIPSLTSTGKAKIEPVGNGWYRCSIPVITGGDCCFYIADNNWSVSYTGDGVSGIYVWGAQLSYSPAALPYVSTTATIRAGLALDYDPITHAPKGLLCEPQTANVIKFSTDLTNPAVWFYDGVVELNAGVAPNGLTEAAKFSGNGTGQYASGPFIMGNVPGSITGNVSCYVKAGSATQFYIMSATNVFEGFDLITGTTFVTKLNGVAQPSSGTGVMQNVGNGWWRCSLTASSLGDFSAGMCLNQEQMWAGSTIYSVYLWGPQAEQVNTRPTSYIPTYAAAVTRAPDDIAVLTSAFPFSLTNLSMAIDVTDNINGITSDFFSVCGSDGVLTESIGLYTPGFYVRSAFAYQALLSNDGNPVSKAAIAAAAADFRSAFHGVLGLPGTTGVMPTYTGTSVRIGGKVAIGGVHGDFYMKKFTIVPRSWSNAELQAKTT